MSKNQWIAFVTLTLALIAAVFNAGSRLGALETKVDALSQTVQLIAPPTVRVGGVQVPMASPLVSGPSATITARR